MKMDTKTILTVATAIGGGLLATKYGGGKKASPLVTGAGVGLGVLAGQMIGEKVAAASSGDTISNTVSKALQQG